MEILNTRKLEDLSVISEKYNLSKYFLRKKIKEGQITYYKIGNRFMLYVDDVEKLIDSCRNLN